MVLQRQMPISLSRPAGPDGDEFRVDLPADLKDWSLCLCLLARGLVERLHIHAANSEFVLTVDRRLKQSDRGRATFSGRRLEVTLSVTELERWEHFFLRAVRDGVAEVDHIDVELKAAADPHTVDLALWVPSARPPMSGADAARLLLGNS